MRLAQALSPYYDVYLPQEDGGLMVDMIAAGMIPEVAARRVFEGDVRAITECDILLMILDGRTVDEGAAFELGLAYAQGKSCYGFKTDPRQLLKTGNNPMIDCPLVQISGTVSDLLEWAKAFAEKRRAAEGVEGIPASLDERENRRSRKSANRRIVTPQPCRPGKCRQPHRANTHAAALR